MIKRRALFAGLLTCLGVGNATAQNAVPAAPRPTAPPRRPTPEERRRQRQAEKTVTAPEPPGKPAPVPNRDIEAPRGLAEAPRARLSPAVIDPAPTQPHLGRSGFAMQAQEDRLIRQPAPGARLNVPF
ncbi:MAG: hypothetical protein INF79_19765 [Roseomonas sp.]|nr:hypothetical protein [Roseomonas sp.]MCA3328299.1 hypothetical protein [Roseomonas sp.]MCA3331497.1 hypothetical protein [Roseomonas sp.]MCA3335576.1 hypothetical protein [Roseomonas sp.]MCA3346022.1 hypothetical protein [Roseomonas sp.]